MEIYQSLEAHENRSRRPSVTGRRVPHVCHDSAAKGGIKRDVKDLGGTDKSLGLMRKWSNGAYCLGFSGWGFAGSNPGPRAIPVPFPELDDAEVARTRGRA